MKHPARTADGNKFEFPLRVALVMRRMREGADDDERRSAEEREGESQLVECAKREKSSSKLERYPRRVRPLVYLLPG